MQINSAAATMINFFIFYTKKIGPAIISNRPILVQINLR